MSEVLIDYYRQRTAEYEDIYSKPERQADLDSLSRLLQSALANHRVLELACGTGYWTRSIAETAELVLGIDSNESVLELARAKKLSKNKVTFQQADAYNFQSLSGSFTALLAAFWWSHIPCQNVGKFLESVRSFLPIGSQVIFADNRYVEGSNTPICRRDPSGNTYQTRKLSDGSFHEVLKNFPSKKELLEVTGPYLNEISIVELDYFWFLKGKT